MRETKQHRNLGILMIVVSVIIAIILSVSSSYIEYLNKFDEENLCAVNKPYDLNVVIIDRTDPWRKVDVEKLKEFLETVRANVKMNDRLTIKVIYSDNGKPTDVKIMFDLCNPGKESDANPLYQNPRKMSLRYKNEFDSPFAALSEALTKSGIAPKSPLLDVISSTINESNDKYLNLIIVSDLFENGNEYNFYEDVPRSEEWVLINEITNSSVAVEVKYIERKYYNEKVRNSVREQWRRYFQHWNISYQDENFMTIN